MTDEELIAALRDLGDRAAYEPHMHHVAADRIEALVKAEARAGRLEAALELIADTDPDEGAGWFHCVANAALKGDDHDR